MALIILGLDGMNEELLELCKESMPYLYSLRDRSFHAALKGVNPSLSGSSWTSIFTGKSIGKHGFVANCFYDKEGELQLVKEEDITEEFFYETIEKANNKMFLMDLPFSRSTKIKGDIVRNIFDASTVQGTCKPASLKSKFPSINDYINTKWKAKSILGALEHMDQTVINNQKILKEVMLHNKKTKEYDLLFFQSAVIDWIQHKVLLDLIAKKNSAETKIAKKTLTRIDNIIKWMIEEIQSEDDFMLFSDHGSSIFDGVLHINCLLKQNGYLIEKTTVQDKDGNSKAIKYKKTEIFFDYLVKKIKEYGPLHNLSKKWYRLIRGYLPYDPVNKKGLKIDRNLTKAVAELKHVPIIKLLEENKEQREKTKEEIKKIIETELDLRCYNTEDYYSVSDPKKIETLHRRFGHILIEIIDKYDFDNVITDKTIIHKKAQFHDSKAFFLAYTKNNDPEKTEIGKRITGEMCDIAPTVLDYFSIPNNLDGKNLNVFNRTYNQVRPKRNPTERIFKKLKI